MSNDIALLGKKVQQFLEISEQKVDDKCLRKEVFHKSPDQT